MAVVRAVEIVAVVAKQRSLLQMNQTEVTMNDGDNLEGLEKRILGACAKTGKKSLHSSDEIANIVSKEELSSTLL